MKIFGITGWKNSGKTGLVERLVGKFTEDGLMVSTIKHAHHTTDIDQPGRDSHRHRAAGARQVVLATPQRWALMHELRGAPEPQLAELLARLDRVDLVLIEGYKRDTHPKIEAHRTANGRELLAPTDKTIRAVASDGPVSGVCVPVLDLDDTRLIAEFIARELGL